MCPVLCPYTSLCENYTEMLSHNLPALTTVLSVILVSYVKCQDRPVVLEKIGSLQSIIKKLSSSGTSRNCKIFLLIDWLVTFMAYVKVLLSALEEKYSSNQVNTLQ